MSLASLLTDRRRRRGRAAATVALLGCLTLVCALFSLGHGPLDLPLSRILSALVDGRPLPADVRLVLSLRVPRLLSAAMVGAALGMAGSIMQTVLGNPLADPFTLGLSSGSALGAALAIVMGFGILNGAATTSSRLAVMGNSFAFGILATLLVLAVARLRNGSSETVLLGGVGLSFLFSAGVALLRYLSTDEQLRDLTLWLMGTFTRSTAGTTTALAIIVLPGLLVGLLLASPLNALLLGEDVAETLGVRVGAVRVVAIVVVTAMTASAVSVSGIIGFVGLITPHVVRMLLGTDHRVSLAACMVMGAGLMLAADTIARLWLSPTELPVGIITSMLGVPVFLGVLLSSRRRFW